MLRVKYRLSSIYSNKRNIFTPPYDAPIKPIRPESRPTDPAYFTGNSNYYQYITALNNMLRKHGLAFPKTNVGPTHIWKDKLAISNNLEMRLTDDKFNDLIAKLNLLKPFQGNELFL